MQPAFLTTFPYDFDGVTTTSGTTDPTPLENPTDEFLGEDRERAQMLPFSATGVSSNSAVEGKFSFTGWDAGSVDGELEYGFVSPTPNVGKYYSFAVDPNVTDLLYLDSIGFKLSRNLNGIRTAVRSSADASKRTCRSAPQATSSSASSRTTWPSSRPMWR